MSPWNLCNNLLHKFAVGIGRRKCPHVLKISRRKPSDLRKLRPQIPGQSLDHFRSPALLTLAAQNFAAYMPVQQDQLPIDRQNRPHLRGPHARLQIGQQRRITRWKRISGCLRPLFTGTVRQESLRYSRWGAMVIAMPLMPFSGKDSRRDLRFPGQTKGRLRRAS